jgi:hypothetical protein
MGIGVVSIQTSQKREQGPPFLSTSADNGLSVDTTTGRIVFGNDVTATTAQLLSSREVPMNGFNIGFKGIGKFGIGTGSPTSLAFFTVDLDGLQFGNPTATFGAGIINAGGSYTLITRDFTTNPGGLENDLNLLVAGSAASSRAQIELSRARGTIPVPLVVQNGDFLGLISGNGYDGANMAARGSMVFMVDGVPAAGSVPTAIIFRTGSTAALDRVRIASSGNVGIGLAAPTALLHLAAGTATANTAPLKLTSGVNLTVAENGAFEYNGTNLFFTRAAATREDVFVGLSGAAAPGTTAGVAIVNFYGTAATNYLGDPNSWASVVLGGTTFKIPLYT